MTDRDPAFLWETAAMRSAAQRRARDEAGHRGEDDTVWVTLRDGHRATGIPVETLRKWARRNTVPSYLDEGPFGTRRMIDLVAVHRRARALGRPVAPVPDPEPSPAAPPPQPAPPPVARPEPAPAPAPDLAPAADQPEPPPGTMIVPVAAWDKMLLQLGNLHQAGQQLAEARERAGRAETEARFLRERLAEMRQELEGRPAAPPLEPEPVPEPPTEAPSTEVEDTVPVPPAPPGRLPVSTRLWLGMVRRLRSPRR
jgi:hypothetical protein